jgi:hypothetical protein
MISATDRMHVVAQRQVRVVGRPEEGGVVSADQEYAGDYGYDLAHEVHAALADIPRPRSAPRTAVGGTAPSFAADVYGDLGYDSAHEGGS